MRVFRVCLFVTFSLVGTLPAFFPSPRPEPAGLVFVGGGVYTVNPRQP